MTEPSAELQKIQEDIRSLILNDLGVDIPDPSVLTYDTQLSGVASPLNIDSVVFMELMIGIEEKFGIVFEDEAITTGDLFMSVSTLADYTHKRIKIAREEGVSPVIVSAPVNRCADPDKKEN